MGAINSLANIIGLIVGLGIISVLALHPAVVTSFFSGVAKDVSAAEAG